jgi:hypothetical protein
MAVTWPPGNAFATPTVEEARPIEVAERCGDECVLDVPRDRCRAASKSADGRA